jgi:hypothetical protein
LRQTGDQLATVQTIEITGPLGKLYGYLADRGSFVQLDNFNPDFLHIFSRDVLARIAAGEEGWEQMVPPEVAALIKKRGFFGYTRAES